MGRWARRSAYMSLLYDPEPDSDDLERNLTLFLVIESFLSLLIVLRKTAMVPQSERRMRG